ncbi:PD-(D/E)XK nuclease family protein [Croceiramulus getboli]|nr:PD-(D/E)XK nuclease family protein [Flavobacteriaceae bacterium YJPT1-3]
MVTFLEEVAQQVIEAPSPLKDQIIVLPSKRAGAFFQQALSRKLTQPTFMPRIYSIEEFIQSISGLHPVNNLELLFTFYTTYAEALPKEETEDFETFISWAQTLVHDFNELDRYLIDSSRLFNYLSAIKEGEAHWSKQKDESSLIQNYLKFWSQLPLLYETLVERLLEQNKGYQGLSYRKAYEEINSYLDQQENTYHVFAGFNALNTAEQQLIQEVLARGNAAIYWDTDRYFFEDKAHDASYFLRDYANTWPYFKKNDFHWLRSHFSTPKTIEVTGIAGGIGQAKYIGNLLSSFDEEQLSNTALVLSDETLLLPVLNALPENVTRLNITMGLPLIATPLAQVFDNLLKMHAAYGERGFYYKDLLGVLELPSLSILVKDHLPTIRTHLTERNQVFLTSEELIGLAPDLELLFTPWGKDPLNALRQCQQLILTLKDHYERENRLLELEYLYAFHSVFNRLLNTLETYPVVSNLKTLLRFYREAVAREESLDFRGDPYQGLQIMGMLESRALDFETVIIASLNEGTLPAGKTMNSYIPYDLKKEFGLPTYKEKDAVYTYHFYRLLQRASNIHLLYNTKTDGLNSGEKSRFILQMAVDRPEAHRFRESIAAPLIHAPSQELIRIEKTPEILAKIKAHAAHGLSPSALTTYIRNPIDYYKRYILQIEDPTEVEETIAHNTLGTVVHETLEALYQPTLGRALERDDFKHFKEHLPEVLQESLTKTYGRREELYGKNLLIQHVAARFVENFLALEKKLVDDGHEIIISGLEQQLKVAFKAPALQDPIFLKGTVDRMDHFDGIPRIIDYKTGKVEQSELNIYDWEALTTDYKKHAKAFQVLTYAQMKGFPEGYAGIYSFRNLSAGFLSLRVNKQPLLSTEIQQHFQEQLLDLLRELLSINVPFIEKEMD